jgi:hypothetical protein
VFLAEGWALPSRQEMALLGLWTRMTIDIETTSVSAHPRWFSIGNCHTWAEARNRLSKLICWRSDTQTADLQFEGVPDTALALGKLGSCDQ